MSRRRHQQPQSSAVFEQMVAASDPQERARLRQQLFDLLAAETLARHGPPDPNGRISTVKGRFPVELHVVGHVFPDGTSIDYGGPVDKPACSLPSAERVPPPVPLAPPWVFRLSADEET